MGRYIVNKADFIDNIHTIQTYAESVPIWAVVKGNGYGLGIASMVSLFLSQNIDHFCVSEVEDVQTIREIGGQQVQILMMQPTTDPNLLSSLITMDAVCTISSWEDAVNLNNAALMLGKKANAHLKIDTGMGRYGFSPKETIQILNIFQYLDGISISGTYTHFAAASNQKKTKQQYNEFLHILNSIRSAGFDPGQCHCCNSASFFLYPEMHMDGVRIGSGWLGRMTIPNRFGLHKIGCCESRVEEIRRIEKGMSTGYASTWKASRPTRLAIIPIGWYHGFCTQHNSTCCEFRSCFSRCLCHIKSFLRHQPPTVRVNGHACPVCGRVGMLHTAVDVTDIDCQLRDTVTLEINPLLQKGLPIEFQS